MRLGEDGRVEVVGVGRGDVVGWRCGVEVVGWREKKSCRTFLSESIFRVSGAALFNLRAKKITSHETLHSLEPAPAIAPSTAHRKLLTLASSLTTSTCSLKMRKLQVSLK